MSFWMYSSLKLLAPHCVEERVSVCYCSSATERNATVWGNVDGSVCTNFNANEYL